MEGETEMSEELIKLASGQFDIGSVQRLVLCALNITRIAALQGCSSLTSLDLSNNALFACTGLDAVSGQLRTLNVAHNKLSDLSPLRILTSLEILKLQGNRVAEVAQFFNLTPLPQLRSVYFQDHDNRNQNPVCTLAEYRASLQAAAPKLTCIDGDYFLGLGFEPKDRKSLLLEDRPPITLPPSEPWVGDTCWANVLSTVEDDRVLGQAPLDFKGRVVDCKAALAKADASLAEAQKLLH
eukprot:GGOE01049340.1.p1 GENE.GGOE01049340.1~~GGOE01049340.1.p1  ORF type:complete len:239 (+),score=74.45 GGOE01049340.1:79-795(+)